MDGALLATAISSGVAVSGAIVGGFWRVLIKIGEQNKAIGRLEGEVKGFGVRMKGYEIQLDGFNTRADRLDKRMNGFLDSYLSKEKEKKKK